MVWHTASRLMNHWFSMEPAHSFTKDEKNLLLSTDAYLINSKKINVDIVKMSWAMNYHQVTKGIDSLMKTWNSLKGKERLLYQLKRKGILDLKNYRWDILTT
nr:DUF6402 family protein [Pantoea sp. S61]